MKIKHHKEKKSKKHSSGTGKSHSKKDPNGLPLSTETNEKATELNPIFIQSLLKESKLKVNNLFKN